MSVFVTAIISKELKQEEKIIHDTTHSRANIGSNTVLRKQRKVLGTEMEYDPFYGIDTTSNVISCIQNMSKEEKKVQTEG
jgi:hypothetical protein